MSCSETAMAELSVVVLALRSPPELVDAVASLVAQDRSVEIVVVNSGGGDAAMDLRRHGFDVPVVQRAERLMPGGARNAGIAATSGRYIGFLAADCLAEGGWAANRLVRHEQGADAVASALTNATPRNVAAWASHMLLFARRMPGVVESEAVLYGMSYDRRLFERFGLFREDLRTGEDTEFHGRFDSTVRVVLASDVRTAHRGPRTVRGVLTDQYHRGRRMAVAVSGPAPRRTTAIGAIRRVPRLARLALAAAEPAERRYALAAAPLMPLGAAAYALGSLSARRSR